MTWGSDPMKKDISRENRWIIDEYIECIISRGTYGIFDLLCWQGECQGIEKIGVAWELLYK